MPKVMGSIVEGSVAEDLLLRTLEQNDRKLATVDIVKSLRCSGQADIDHVIRTDSRLTLFHNQTYCLLCA